jgi:hypothetical protein
MNHHQKEEIIKALGRLSLLWACCAAALVYMLYSAARLTAEEDEAAVRPVRVVCADGTDLETTAAQVAFENGVTHFGTGSTTHPCTVTPLGDE